MSERIRRASGLLGLKARKYAIAASAAFRERTAYRGSFLGSVLSYGLFVFVFSQIWNTVYSGRSDIDGYGRAQMIWYFIVAEIPGMSFAGVFWSLSQDMKSGQVSYLVSRPYSFVLFSYAQGAGKAFANCAILFVEGIVLGLLLAGSPQLAGGWATLGQMVGLLASLALAGSVYFLMNLAIAMTAFWIEENTAFFWIFQKLALIVGTFIPIELLPAAAQGVAWCSPFPAMSYAPAKLLSSWPGSEGELAILGYQGAWAIAAALLCQGIYASGRSRLTVNGG
jgi:ABC-2 type transport system permease protein